MLHPTENRALSHNNASYRGVEHETNMRSSSLRRSLPNISRLFLILILVLAGRPSDAAASKLTKDPVSRAMKLFPDLRSGSGDEFCYLIADNDGFDDSNDALTILNDSFNEISVGKTGTVHIEGLTFVPDNGKLYGSDAERFGEINVNTGVFTFIGNFGNGNGVQGNVDFDDIDGLTWDPFTDIMYASVRRNGDDVLIQVDITTGAAIVDAFGPGQTYVPVEKINDLDDIDDIAISTDDGMMYAIQNENGHESRLITIDKATGATNDLGDLDVENVEGLGFYPDGRLLGITGDSFRSVVEIKYDPFSSTTIKIEDLGINGNKDYEGIACLTEPDNTIGGTVFGRPERIDLDLKKTASVTDEGSHDAIEYTVRLLNDTLHPVSGPNATGGSGLAGVTVELYRDKGSIGTFDGADEFVSSTVTGAGGTYAFTISANGTFIVRVDLTSFPSAYTPPDNEEAVSFAGFGLNSSGNDFRFFTIMSATGIEVADLFPANATFGSGTPTQGTFNTSTKKWTVGSVAPGDSAMLVINATTTFDGQIENCAQVSKATGTDIDSTPGNGVKNGEDDQDCEPTDHDFPEADLELAKTSSASSVALGDSFSYTLTLTNKGSAGATNVTVTDPLPYGVSWVGSTPSAAYDAGTHTVTWTVASLAASASTSLDVDVTFDGFSGVLPSSPFLADGEYVLRNHPDGDVRDPFYGLRLDKLFGNKTPITFDFEHAQSDVRMQIDGSDVVIDGVAWGGDDTGSSYANAGLWNIHFEFDGVLTGVSGDDDKYVPDASEGSGSGTISPQYSTSYFSAGDVYHLGDKSDGSFSFRLGDENNDAGHRGHDGISGWGWINHDGDGTLDHKATSDFLFTAYPIPDQVENCAQVQSADQSDPDSTPGNAGPFTEDDDACVIVPREEPDEDVDIEVHKVVSDYEAPIGSQQDYTITVKNSGPGTATGVEVTDELPGGLSYVSDSATQGSYNENTGIWTVGTLTPNQTETLTITVTVDGVGGNTGFLGDGEYRLHNHPGNSDTPPGYGLRLDELFGGQDDVTFDFNHDDSEVIMEISGTTISISGQVFGGVDTGLDYDPALSGLWDVDFTFSGVVSGVPGDDDLYVHDTDAGVSSGTITPQFSTAYFTAGDVYDMVDKSDGNFSFRLGNETNDLGHNGYNGISGWGWVMHGQNGTTTHVPISDWIFTAVPLTPRILNCAELTAVNETDSDSSADNGTHNGEDDYECMYIETSEPQIDLDLEKSVDTSTASVGDTVNFTISVTNDADVHTTATNVRVLDTIPAGMTVVDTTPSANVTVNNGAGTVEWLIASLAPGQTVDLVLEVTIQTPGFKCNCAEVIDADQNDRDDQYDDGTGDDFDCAGVTTNDPYVDLHLTKDVDETEPGIGEEITYTLTVANQLPASSIAYNVSAVDQLPDGLTITGTNPTSNVTVNHNTNVVSWYIPGLAPGADVQLQITATVDEPGDHVNCAEIMSASGSDSDSTPGNGDESEDDMDCVTTLTGDPTIDVSLIKTVNDSHPAIGETITFTLAATNDASAIESATNVIAQDQLPAGMTIDPGFSAPDASVNGSGLVTWDVGTLDPGETEYLEIPVIVDVASVQVNCAEIMAHDQDDMDSMPGNGMGHLEDDEDCVTITPNAVPNDAMCYLVADNDTHAGSADVLTYLTNGGIEISVGPTGTQNIHAIEYLGSNGKLYAADGNRLGTINPATGVFSPIGGFGSGIGALGAKNFDDVVGLALDPFTGYLYGSVRTSGNDLLIRINPLTGGAVTNAFGAGKTYVEIPAVSGLSNVDDIAIRPSTGQMYGIMNGSGNTRLVKIDKTTGASTDDALLDVANVRGLAYKANGHLYGTLGSTDREVRRIHHGSSTTDHVASLGVDGNLDYESITCNTTAPNLLTGTVFLDNNEDGVLNGGDTGQGGVTVQLYTDVNSNGVVDGGDVNVGNVVSASDGTYAFHILATGYFVVQTDLGTYPAGAVLTTDNMETAHFTGYGQIDEHNDFGYKQGVVQYGSIGDRVFEDTDHNGIEDPGEPGIGGVLVRLYSGTCPAVGSPIATRVTSSTGGYDFMNLPAGTYCVDVRDDTVPTGYIHTTANDPMTVALANGEDYNLADFGYWYNLVQSQADLEVTKSVDTSSPALNDVVTFTITITNNGPADATGVIVRDIIPVGLVYQGSEPSVGGYEANKLGFWTIGNLAVGQTETLLLHTQVVITNMIENIAQVVAVDQPDPDSTPGNGVPSEDDQDNALVESRGPGSVGDIIAAECADIGTINALAYDEQNGLVFAGSEVGMVHISNDDGVNWPTFLQTDHEAPVRDIVLAPDGTVYAGSFGDGVYRSVDSGNNWTNVGPSLEDVNDLDVNDLNGYVYAAANGRVILYNGISWITVGSGTNPFLGEQVLAVVYDENNSRVIASSAGQGTWKYEAGIWTAVNSGLPTGKINTLFNGPNGEILAGTNQDGVYLFSGASWSQFGNGLDDEPIESIGSGANGELLAGARETGAYFYNYITGTWVSIGNLPVFTVTSMTGGSMGEVYAGAPGEGIYVIYDSDFDGIPDIAYQVANFMTSAVIQDLVVAPNGDMWAATFGYGILYSNDGGNCWTRMNRGLNNLWTFAIERGHDGTLFIGIWADGKGGVWRSRDDGRNWENVAYPTRQIISLAIDPNDDNIVYAGANISGEGALFKSTDGGDTWGPSGNFIYPVWAVTVDPNDSDRVLVGTQGAGVYESLDAGSTFTQIGSQANGLDNAYVFDMEFAPAGTPYPGMLLAATNAGTYRYDEFAEAWTLFGVNSEDYQFRTLAYDGTHIFGGTWNAGVVEYDALSGEWTDFGLADIPVIAFAIHPQSETLVIGTSGKGVFLSQGMDFSVDAEDEETLGSELPTSFTLEQNYPNPFNPSTTIPFDIKETGPVKVTVFDVLGREVAILVDGMMQAGAHAVTWEAGNLPSGTYLAQLQAGGRSFTKTMVLLK